LACLPALARRPRPRRRQARHERCPSRPRRRDRRDAAGCFLAALPDARDAQLLTRVPKAAQSFVATMVRTIFAQPDANTVREQHARIVDQLESRFPRRPRSSRRPGPTSSPHGLPQGALAAALVE
jgi:hypothetical protein